MDRFEKFERCCQGGVAVLMMAAIAITIAGFLLLALTVPANAQSAEELFQQGLRMERSSGDYAAAIALYEQVASSDDAERRLVASALVQLGKAYENLGRTEAGNAYARVVAEFSDLDDLAAEAWEGIRRIGSAGTSQSILDKEPFSVTTLDFYHELMGSGSGLSPSGRYLAAMGITGSIEQVDLETQEREILVSGTVKQLEDGTWRGGFGMTVKYSPGGSEISFGWWDWDNVSAEIRVANLETGVLRTVFDVKNYFNSSYDEDYDVDRSETYVLDWTKDGSALLAFVVMTEKASDLVTFNEAQWHTLLLMIPLDGSTPQVIANEEEMEHFSWAASCFAGDDKYVMIPYFKEGEGGIQRIDIESGVQVPWRTARDFTIRGVACPAEEDKVVYISEYLSTPYLMAGDPNVIDPEQPDELLTAIDSDIYEVVGYSEKANLLIDSSAEEPAKRIAYGADSESKTLLEAITVLEGESSRRGWWDPSGTKYSWTSGQSLKIWNRTTGTTNSFDIEGSARNSRWFPDRSKIGLWGGEDPLELEFSIVDINTGRFATSVPVPGLRIHAIGADGNSLLVTDRASNENCIERFDLTTLVRSPFFCLDSGKGPISFFKEKADYSKYLYSTKIGYASTIGVVNADGSSQRIVYEPADSTVAMIRIRWSSSDHVAFATRETFNWPPMNAIFGVDIESGEVSPMYESIFSELVVYDFHVSPDEETVVFWARPIQKAESPELFIMHKVLGETPKN